MLQSLASSLLRPPASPLPAAARCVSSSGSVKITVPLNFWAGERRTIQVKYNKENVYEPATGKLRSWGDCLDIIPLSDFSHVGVKLIDSFTPTCFKVKYPDICILSQYNLEKKDSATMKYGFVHVSIATAHCSLAL